MSRLATTISHDCGVPKGIVIGFPKALFKTDTKG